MADEENTFSWYQRNGPYLWAGVKFVLYMGVFFILLTSNFGQKELVEPFTATIAVMTSLVLNLLGIPTHVEGTIVMGESV